MNGMADILTLGELLVDFTPVQVEGYPLLYSPNPGGAPANVAVQLARLGVRAGFVGKVGRDGFGRMLKDCLTEHQVEVSALVMDPRYSTTLAFVQLDAKGDRSFTFCRKPGADTQLELDEVDPGEIERCSILHFGSLSLTGDPSRTTALTLVRRARDAGKLISYDPNWRPPLWDSEEEGIRWMREGLSLCDICKVSEEELEMLTGRAGLESGLEALGEMGVHTAVATLGAAGCAFLSGGRLVRVPTYDTEVVDTTGSGDSFWGAFLYGLYTAGCSSRAALEQLTEQQLETICRFANGAGSLTASRPGGIPALGDKAEIEHCMQAFPLLLEP